MDTSNQSSTNQQSPDIYANPDINFFATTNFRNQFRKFGIKIDDRRRHMYIVGKTGMGKTTLMENMVLNDIYAGHGVAIVDPHGDMAEKIINFIPSRRINDVVYFNPADVNYPIGFNILETVNPDHKHLVASGLMSIFKKIWVDMWSSRMEYILNNTILALMDFPGTTLLGINRILSDTTYRRRIVRNIKDPVVKSFWTTEFASYQARYAQEAVAPIQNKIGQFLSASIIRNIVAQVKSKIDIRDIMDSRKIFIMNLSKGRIGEDNSRLLGGMLVTKIQLSAMERVNISEDQRSDFFLYVDEFQNFATPSFANILSEARKYRLSLIIAHQYMLQLDETVLAAVIGNVGSILTFRVGSTDAEILAKEFIPVFEEPDLINLGKFNMYLKLMIDGVASRPFSATTLPPIGHPTNSAEKVIRVSRERYAVERDKIEDKISRWSGMEIIEEYKDEYDGGNKIQKKDNTSKTKTKSRSDSQNNKFNKQSAKKISKSNKSQPLDSDKNNKIKKKKKIESAVKLSELKPVVIADNQTEISLSNLKQDSKFEESVLTKKTSSNKVSLASVDNNKNKISFSKPIDIGDNKKKNKRKRKPINNKQNRIKSVDSDIPTKTGIHARDISTTVHNNTTAQSVNNNFKPKSKFLQYKNTSQPSKKDNLGFINQDNLDSEQNTGSDLKIEPGKVVRFD